MHASRAALDDHAPPSKLEAHSHSLTHTKTHFSSPACWHCVSAGLVKQTQHKKTTKQKKQITHSRSLVLVHTKGGHVRCCRYQPRWRSTSAASTQAEKEQNIRFAAVHIIGYDNSSYSSSSSSRHQPCWSWSFGGPPQASA